MKRKFIISLCLSLFMALFSMPALAQDQTVKGTVVDENGDPIIGASVRVNGKNGTGVITDLDGNYTISVPKGSKVTISYIGYITQTVAPGGKVQMKEDAQNLEEVVVVGYGVQKKAHLTGSVATVQMDDIQDLSGAGLASSLSGLMNGVSVSGGDSRVGNNATIKIRDTNDFGDIGITNVEPLYVIDGYVYPNDVKSGTSNVATNLGAQAFNNLDPSEVESISVLKDASAAVYGARAANGVILVTTKKGKLGAPRISYNGTFGITDAVSHPKMLSAYNYGRLYNAVAAADPTVTSLNNKTGLFQADELEAMKNLNYDLLDKYWDTGFTMQHSVNVSGATEKASYFAGISYFEQDGNLGNLDYDRWNYRAGVDVKISQYLKANLSVSGDYSDQNKPNVSFGSSGAENDYRSLLFRPRYLPETVDGRYILGYGISNSESNSAQKYAYGLMQNNGDYNKTMNSNTNINGSLEYDFAWSKILKGLKLRFSYSKSISTAKGNEYGSEFTLYKMINRTGSGSHLYTPIAGEEYDPYLVSDNFEPITYDNGGIGGYLSRTMSRTDNYQINFTASYARTFGKHDVSALFSIEKSEAETEWMKGQVSDPYSFTTGQSTGAAGQNTYAPQWTRYESGTLSYIGRLNYSYADKYLFEFLLRSDASTKFAPKNYWGVFPSVSAGWVISEENWFKDKVKWVDFLKVRASFGMTGRDNTPAWQWMKNYDIWSKLADGAVFGTSNTATGQVLRLNNDNAAINTDVHWDKSYKANLGIDLHVLNQRLGITFETYRVWNREMFMNLSQTVPGTVGGLSAYTNVGEMDNWGYELSLNWHDKIGKDFKYRIGLNTGYSDNKVLKADFATENMYCNIQKGGRSDIGTWGMQCIGMFRSFQDINEYFDKYGITSYMGLSKDQVRPGMLIYKDIRGAYDSTTGTYAGPDGIVDKDQDQVQLSHRNNPYGFTVNMSAEWKGLSINAQMNASWGGYSFLPGYALKPAYGMEATNMPSFWNPDDMFVYQDIYDAEGNLLMKENRNGSLPNLAYASVNSSTSNFWRISGTRVTLNRLTIAYKIPTAWVKFLGIQSARINVTGQNLLSLYNPYPDNFIDPLSSNYGSYPKLRKWTIGVNLSF
ncbi:MAG: TonB-dependent receptor [Prevotella sp.]|nr:TonB-dependent receptor [Prevotella sp.]MDY4408784.1 TonB-dependent receptor [Prevotella sp.]